MPGVSHLGVKNFIFWFVIFLIIAYLLHNVTFIVFYFEGFVSSVVVSSAFFDPTPEKPFPFIVFLYPPFVCPEVFVKEVASKGTWIGWTVPPPEDGGVIPTKPKP